MTHIVDIHTHYSGRSKGGDPLGVGNAKRSQRVGKNMYSDYKGLPGLADYELDNFQLQQDVSHKAGIDYRLMSNPVPAEVLAEISPETLRRRVQALQRRDRRDCRQGAERHLGPRHVNALESDHVKEAERLMGPMKFKGLQLVTSWHGNHTPDPEFDDGW